MFNSKCKQYYHFQWGSVSTAPIWHNRLNNIKLCGRVESQYWRISVTYFPLCQVTFIRDMKCCKKMPKIPADEMLIHTGNWDIRVYFLDSDSPLQLTVCHTITNVNLWYKSKARILCGKDAFAGLGCWQDYASRIVYVKQLMTSMVLEKKLIYNQTKLHEVHYSRSIHQHHTKHNSASRAKPWSLWIFW